MLGEIFEKTYDNPINDFKMVIEFFLHFFLLFIRLVWVNIKTKID